MKKHVLTAMAWGLGLAGLVMQGASAQEIQSLRGMSAIDADSTQPQIQHYLKDNEPIARDYLQQPPLIPHQIDGYIINLKHNKCLSCHSWTNYKKANATKISQTHFESRDGAIMANVSARRYFCTQCHVPQVTGEPLVENTFKPVKALKVR
jgi:cytochrome c-type protein NapB